jgi:hypothetical protein
MCTGTPINEYGDCSLDDAAELMNDIVALVGVDDDDDSVDDECPTGSVTATTTMTTTPNTRSTNTAQMMMDISDQYYCIGKYYQYELCQPSLALQYYYNAYHTAVQCYRNVVVTTTTSSSFPSTNNNETKVATISPTHESSLSLLLLEEIQGQIQLTKECIGRIHFELGNIEEALQML